MADPAPAKSNPRPAVRYACNNSVKLCLMAGTRERTLACVEEGVGGRSPSAFSMLVPTWNVDVPAKQSRIDRPAAGSEEGCQISRNATSGLAGKSDLSDALGEGFSPVPTSRPGRRFSSHVQPVFSCW